MEATQSAAAASGEGRRSPLSYDYVTVEAEASSAREVTDCYEGLGWELAERKERYPGGCTLQFRRDRKIANREQLNRLQVKLDDAIAGVKVLEQEKTRMATVLSILLGVVGALVFGGGLCLCLLYAELKFILAGCVLGVVGAALCGLAYLVYRKVRERKTVAMNTLIDRKREEIGGLLEEAQKYLA